MTGRGLVIASLSLVIASLSSASSARAQEGGPFMMVTPDKRYVTVVQGPTEPQSIGSYALRLYQISDPQYPTQDFVAGVVRPRDGFLFRHQWQDVTGDGHQELIVVTSSAGTGDYMSADAFHLGHRQIKLVAEVDSLEPTVDLIAALKKAAGHGQ